MNVRNNLGELLLGIDIVLDPYVIHQIDDSYWKVDGSWVTLQTSVMSGSEFENVDRSRSCLQEQNNFLFVKGKMHGGVTTNILFKGLIL